MHGYNAHTHTYTHKQYSMRRSTSYNSMHTRHVHQQLPLQTIFLLLLDPFRLPFHASPPVNVYVHVHAHVCMCMWHVYVYMLAKFYVTRQFLTHMETCAEAKQRRQRSYIMGSTVPSKVKKLDRIYVSMYINIYTHIHIHTNAGSQQSLHI